MTTHRPLPELSMDEHLLHCGVCASGDDACDVGLRLAAVELAPDTDLVDSDETLEDHRYRLHNPRDPEAEPCCSLCCDCADAELDDDGLE